MDRLSPGPLLSSVLDATHPLVDLATTLDWPRISDRFRDAGPRLPGIARLPGRVFAGLLILRELYDLSDEQLHRQWRENPYFQYFCGFEELQHRVPFDPILMRLCPRLTRSELNEMIEPCANTAALQSSSGGPHRRPRQKRAPRVQGAASIYDVARKAGVSIKTVSLVLNERGSVSERTAVAVRAAIVALNYQPDLAARHLAQRKSSGLPETGGAPSPGRDTD